jgi:predicted dehydrogenase
MLWLIGTGSMARAYLAVLQHLQQPIQVIGRSTDSCSAFSKATGTKVQSGGIAHWLKTKPPMPSAVIVAVNITELFIVCQQLLQAGVKKILLEKPGALYQFQLDELEQLSVVKGATVVIAYNRRFFAAVQAAKHAVEQDGGLLSCNFELTEWADSVRILPISPEVKQRWVVANTAHVIDTVFYLTGEPTQLECQTAGELDWHPSMAMLAGCGVTNLGVLLSYHGNWNSAGRWSIELNTANRKLILRPMEQLSEQLLGSMTQHVLPIGLQHDSEFKPGLLQQVNAFLQNQLTEFCDLTMQRKRLAWYEKMANYPDSHSRPMLDAHKPNLNLPENLISAPVKTGNGGTTH